MLNSVKICIAIYLLLRLVRAAVVYEDPVDVTVNVDQLAEFNCTVNCSCTSNVGWCIAGRSNVIDNSVPGLTIMSPEQQSPTCTSGRKTYIFTVLVTKALEKSEIAIYCAAYGNHSHQSQCSFSGPSYSRPALLTVKAAETVALSSILRIPEITPSPSPCPTHLMQESTSPAVVTLTTTVTLATTITPSLTNCPTPAITSTLTGEVSSVSAASARVTCAQAVIVLAGLVIASIQWLQLYMQA